MDQLVTTPTRPLLLCGKKRVCEEIRVAKLVRFKELARLRGNEKGDRETNDS